jgi:hypothetical protein
VRTPPNLPEEICAQRIPLDIDVGVYEDAWTRRAARKVIEAIEGSNVAILGGEVLRRAAGCISYTYDNWDSHRAEREEFGAYAVRSRRETRAYIDAYPDPEDGTVLYVMVFATEQELEKLEKAPRKWLRWFRRRR